MTSNNNLTTNQMSAKTLKQGYIDDWLIYDKRSKTTKTLKKNLFDTVIKPKHSEADTKIWDIH